MIPRQRSAGSFRSQRTIDEDEEFTQYPMEDFYEEDIRKKEVRH